MLKKKNISCRKTQILVFKVCTVTEVIITKFYELIVNEQDGWPHKTEFTTRILIAAYY